MHIKQFICGLPKELRHPLLKIVSSLEVVVWGIKGKSVPPPHNIKVKVISDYAKRFQIDTFIETGTYLGQTIDDLEETFDKIYSVELDKVLYQNAKKMFSKNRNIEIIQGNSAVILPKLIKHLKEHSLFWLDAHYSGGITTKGSKESPILGELKAISKSKIRGHIILVDDAREFTGSNSYPSIGKVKQFVAKNFPGYKMIVKEDIIRIHL